MKIKNPKADALPSTITISDFAKAMSQVDLSSVPAHQTKTAIFDHMMRIMSDTVKDGQTATKIRQARLARLLERNG